MHDAGQPDRLVLASETDGDLSGDDVRPLHGMPWGTRESRPATRYLTGFYLSIAGGGALGGVFVAIIAPRVFTFFTELRWALRLPAASYSSAGCTPACWSSWTTRNFLIRIPIIALLVGALTAGMTIRAQGRDPVQARVRNFYGMLRVVDTPTTQGVIRELDHGTIRHGFHFRTTCGGDGRLPTTVRTAAPVSYSRRSPVRGGLR